MEKSSSKNRACPATKGEWGGMRGLIRVTSYEMRDTRYGMRGEFLTRRWLTAGQAGQDFGRRCLQKDAEEAEGNCSCSCGKRSWSPLATQSHCSTRASRAIFPRPKAALAIFASSCKNLFPFPRSSRCARPCLRPRRVRRQLCRGDRGKEQ